MSNEMKEVCRWCGATFCYCCPKCGKSVIEHADGCSLDPQHKRLLNNNLTVSTAVSHSIKTPEEWWANFIYYLNRGCCPQRSIPDRMRAPDCYLSGHPSPSIKDFCLSYQSRNEDGSPQVSEEHFDRLVADKDHAALLSIMNDAWFNGPGQCGEAWNVLCDLISESWVFEKDDGGPYQDVSPEECL